MEAGKPPTILSLMQQWKAEPQGVLSLYKEKRQAAIQEGERLLKSFEEAFSSYLPIFKASGLSYSYHLIEMAGHSSPVIRLSLGQLEPADGSNQEMISYHLQKKVLLYSESNSTKWGNGLSGYLFTGEEHFKENIEKLCQWFFDDSISL